MYALWGAEIHPWMMLRSHDMATSTSSGSGFSQKQPPHTRWNQKINRNFYDFFCTILVSEALVCERCLLALENLHLIQYTCQVKKSWYVINFLQPAAFACLFNPAVLYYQIDKTYAASLTNNGSALGRREIILETMVLFNCSQLDTVSLKARILCLFKYFINEFSSFGQRIYIEWHIPITFNWHISQQFYYLISVLRSHGTSLFFLNTI